MGVEDFRKALGQVRKNVRKACEKAGRNPDDVRILVVTRNHFVPEIRELIDAGCRLFGENRVQEALQKISFFDSAIEWHLIGHLQSVKAKVAIEAFRLIHGVDSLRIGFDLQRACEKLNREVDILLHINASGMNEPFGVEPGETINLIRELIKFPMVHIKGFMTLASQMESPEQSRPFYRKLRELRDQIRNEAIEGVELKWLAMGSSFDYPVAVEEGANIIRITNPVFPEEE
ncbi:YggS family pyridoxal phosphate-dependent enzyme [Candidatus Sumerlaeota bacterium]|nr:YggS family pyridoxal phosphate-dependent enzyme [Candidatus Sumerlaeota bacterium]